MTLACKVTVAWKEALRDGAREEEGRQEETGNLESVEG